MAVNVRTVGAPDIVGSVEPGGRVRITRQFQIFLDQLRRRTGGDTDTLDAVVDADIIVGSADSTLTAERVLTDTSTIEWDIATAAQAKASIVDASVDTTQLADEAVTYAKMQHTSGTDVLLGRSTAGAGDVEEIACTAAGRELINDASAADQRTTLGLGALAVLATVGTTEIDDEAVTYAKMQHVSATDKLLGRSTAGAGDVEEITCTAAGRALLDDADDAAQRVTMGVEIGVDVQAYDANNATGGSTGGTGSAGAGNQYIEITVAGTTYRVLHDGTV